MIKLLLFLMAIIIIVIGYPAKAEEVLIEIPVLKYTKKIGNYNPCKLLKVCIENRVYYYKACGHGLTYTKKTDDDGKSIKCVGKKRKCSKEGFLGDCYEWEWE